MGYGALKFVDGWHCPDRMGGPGAYLRRSQELDQHIARLKHRRSCVQAGGHIGIYPKVLSASFQRVYTFEPDVHNFACLAANTAEAPNIYAARAFLGDRHGGRELLVHGSGTGGHHTGGVGHVPMYCVDDLGLADCDALFIDVEGVELEVLAGARATLKKCKPLLVLEENKQGRWHGKKTGDLEAYVTPLGYRLIERVGEDLVLAC
jgi:FkbM family methyltransferase